MEAPAGIEFFHGYTYSSHVLACAASIATLDTYADEGLFERAAELSPYFEEAAHSLAELPHVIDVRNLGLVAGVETGAAAGCAGFAGLRGVRGLLRGGAAGPGDGRHTGDLTAR